MFGSVPSFICGCICAGWPHRRADAALPYCRPEPHAPAGTAPAAASAAAPQHPCARWTCCTRTPLRRTHCGPVGRDIFAQLYRPLFGVSLHIQTPPIVNLWYSLCTGRGRYVPPGLDFCAGRAILLHGHKNRGAERLRSAFCGVPFYLTGQCRRGSLQNCPFFHKPRAPAGSGRILFLCTIVLRRGIPMTKTYSKTRILVEGALMIALSTVLSMIQIPLMPHAVPSPCSAWCPFW